MTPLAYLLQRGTAAILAPLVLAHLVLIIIAIKGGLTGAEILGRTQGSVGWAAFYGLFVLAAAVHAGIGLQTILQEWTPLEDRAARIASHIFMLALLLLGFRAVAAVVLT